MPSVPSCGDCGLNLQESSADWRGMQALTMHFDVETKGVPWEPGDYGLRLSNTPATVVTAGEVGCIFLETLLDAKQGKKDRGAEAEDSSVARGLSQDA